MDYYTIPKMHDFIINDTGDMKDPKYVRTLTSPHFMQSYVKYVKRADCKKYIYMVTFTLKPESAHMYAEAESYVIRVASRSALKIVKYEYCTEETKAGVKHWHALVVTTKALKKDRFNYYIKKYGNIDIRKNKAQQTDEILNYMTKCENTTKIL